MEEQTVDIEKIMEEIRREAERIRREAPVPFEEPEESGPAAEPQGFDAARCRTALNLMNAEWNIPYYRPLVGGKLKQLFKRIIRKFVRCVTEPLADDASRFHAETVKMANEIMAFTVQQQRENELCRRRIAALERELAELRARETN